MRPANAEISLPPPAFSVSILWGSSSRLEDLALAAGRVLPITGKGNAELDELLEEKTWVRRLAGRLVEDEHLAEDISQQTMLAALEKPPRTGRVRSWLHTVVRNFVRLSLRERKRRRRREELTARGEKTNGPVDLVELAELRERVVAAVRNLPEPYRGTIVDLYYRELSANDVAKRDGIPANTVRVRNRRALELLRSRLDEAYAGRTRAWALGLALLATAEGNLWADALALSTPLPVDGTAGAAIEEDSPSAPAPAPTFARAAIVVTVVAAIVAVWWLGKGSPRTAETRSIVDGPAASTSSLGTKREAPSDGERKERRQATTHAELGSATNAPHDAAVSCRIVVTSSDTGEPIQGASVRTRLFDMDSEHMARGRDLVEFLMLPGATEHHGVTDDTGCVDVPRAQLRNAIVSVCAAGYEEYREQCRVRRLADRYAIELSPAAVVTVLVEADGHPMESVPVRVDSTSGSPRDGLTDRRGVFRYAMEGTHTAIRVEHEGFAAVRALGEAPLHRLSLVPGSRGTGRVVDGDGFPVADCIIEVSSPPHWRGEPWRTHTDSAGVFTTMNLAAEGKAVVTLRHEGYPVTTVEVTLPWAPRDFVLPQGATVTGTATGPDGLLRSGTVLLVPSTPGFHVRDLPRAAIGVDGSFRLGPVAVGSYDALVEHDVWAPTRIPVPGLSAAEERRIDCRLERGARITGRIRTRDGVTLAGVRLCLGTIIGDEIRGRRAESDATGAFTFEGISEELPFHRPTGNDVRWAMPADDGEPCDWLASNDLILQVYRPHELEQCNGERVPEFGLLGSRNTARIRGGVTRLDLVTTTRREGPRRLFELVDEAGDPVRTLTNLVVIPVDSPADFVGVFAGTDGNPANLQNPYAFDGCLVGFWTRRYAMTYTLIDASRFPLRISLTPAVPVTVTVLGDHRAPVTETPLLVSPIVGGRVSPVAVYCGRTDSRGRFTFDFLPQGAYRLSVPREGTELESPRPRLTALAAAEVIDIGPLDVSERAHSTIIVIHAAISSLSSENPVGGDSHD